MASSPPLESPLGKGDMEDAGPSTPPRSPRTPTRRRPRPPRQPVRCVSLDVCRPQQSTQPILDRIEEDSTPTKPPPGSPVAFSTPSAPSSPTRPRASSSVKSDHNSEQSRPLFPPKASAVPDHLKPGRRRAHTVSVTMPWRKGYAPLPDDPETAVGPRERAGSNHSNHDVADNRGELHDDVVGLLDCVDPEVGTVNHLQNMTNAIMFPPIPSLYSRRPNVCLSNDDDEDTVPTLPSQPKPAKEPKLRLGRHRAESAPVSLRPPLSSQGSDNDFHRTSTEDAGIAKVELEADDKLRAHVDEDMTHELDAHMRKVLLRRKRRDKMKSALRGLWAYLKTPMGIVTAIYGFLVAFWGAAIVLFLLGWIPTSSKHAQDKWVEISSQVTNGLFTVTGVGLIPWRAIDTYRMSRIWTLRSRVRKRRAKLGLPEIKDWNDLPDPNTVPGYINVLSDKEQAELEHQQSAFQASQTWYRPHATPTHTAFPMAWALWNTILMDLNSFFQCILCGCMWGMNYHVRPPWTTGTLIPLSFLCGIGAAILIWQGGVRTKKTKEVENKLSMALGVEGPPVVEKGRPRAATVGTERPSLDVKPKIEAVRMPTRRATVDAGPGVVTVSHLAPLAETEESDTPEPSPTEKHIELDDLALPPVPEISAIELPGLNPKRAST